MKDYFCNAFDWAHTKLSPRYTEAKEQIEVTAEMGRVTSLALLSSSIACIALGISLTAIGLYPAGIAIIFVFLPVGYIAYNTCMICNNAKVIAKNPKLYQPNLGFSLQLDEKKLKIALLHGNFYGEWILDRILNILIEKQIISLRFSKQP